MAFEDHFSGHAEDYSCFRPSYPAALYRWLSDSCPGHRRAWDCATGNGQAARALAGFFHHVDATDASSEQIARAMPANNVNYRVARAERSDLGSGSVDLVTVAQALHWFDLDSFYAEARRVLKPGGMLAVWTYRLSEVCPAVDAVVGRLYTEITGPYWPPQHANVATGYRDLPFPFTEVTPPRFEMNCDWTLVQFAGYLGTWSAVHRYHAETGRHALDLVRARLEDAWGDPLVTRTVSWPLTLRAGYTLKA